MEQNDERRILGQMVRFQNQAAVRIDNDRVNRREIDLGGISPHNQGQEKENKLLFHVPLLDTAVRPADGSTETANSDFTKQTFHLPGCKTRWMGLFDVSKTKTTKKVNGNAPPHFFWLRSTPLLFDATSSNSGAFWRSLAQAHLTVAGLVSRPLPITDLTAA
jgi:hypothetical protein